MTPDVWRAVVDGTHGARIEVERDRRCVLFTHVRSPSDRTVFVLGTDITERRIAERHLADHAERLAEYARFPDMNPSCRW